MKAIRTLLVLVALAAGWTPAQAQIPVTDVVSITTDVMNQVETIAQWVEQIAQMKAQYDQMQKEYEAMNGKRNLGEVLWDQAYREYLEEDWQDVYDKVRSGDYDGLSSRAKTVYNQSRYYDNCAHLEFEDAKAVCRARAYKAAQDKAYAVDAFVKAKGRLTQIEGLMKQINQTSDPKAIAEISARIGAEIGAIANEETKLRLFKMVSDSEDKINQQQTRELQARTWGAKGYGINAVTPTFNH